MAAKGTIWPSEHSTYNDKLTGRLVHQMTSHPSINHPAYFLQSSFLPNDRSLVFTSYRTGMAQLFRAEFPDGELHQLTDGPAIHPFSPAIHPSGNCIYFVRGGSIWNLEFDSLFETLIVAFDHAQLGECSLSSDGEWLTAAIKQGSQQGIVTGRTNGTGWQLIPFPRTVIHPQFHPLEPEWLIFAGDPAPRMFRVRRDGSGMECLYENDNEEFVVHETFLGSTGDIVFTVWPRALERFSWSTKERSRIAGFNAWHIAPDREGTKVLCDTNHPDRGIHIIDVASGSVEPICLSEASNSGSQWTQSRYALADDFARSRSAAKSGALSWMETATDTVYGPQWTHPHPSFSRDERHVAFASDRTGHTQVYVVEL